MRATGLVAWLIAPLALAVAQPAAAFHSYFSYRVDRFELDGNVYGVLDETPGFVDEFDGDDYYLSADWLRSLGNAYRRDGYLVLSGPGAHFPSPDGGELDVTIAAGQRFVYDQSGDFVATAFWEAPASLPLGHHFHLSAFTWKSGASSFFHETFGIGLQNLATGLGIEQHRTEVDLDNGVFRNTFTDVVPIDPASTTGQIGFRIAFDDATNVATTAFSIDGGTTWTSPFAGTTIFVDRDWAQFLLSADAAIATTTTTSTLPPVACDPAACRGGTEPFSGRLLITNKAGDRRDALSWKLETDEATSVDDFGAPTEDTPYEICIGARAFVVPLLQVSIPAGRHCFGQSCWRRIGTSGYRYEDAAGVLGGITLLTLRAGASGKAKITMRAKDEALERLHPPVYLPMTIRVRAAGGPCWASTFSRTGVGRYTPKRLVALSD